MEQDELFSKLITEYSEHFEGWDFSYLLKSGRMQESVLPWNYRSVVEASFSDSSVILDMGTGGGEFLSTLKNLSKETYATEGYEQNVTIAQQHLRDSNIEVRYISSDTKIPYDSNFFTVIINRHESFDAREVKRILKPQGKFITQQVGGINDLNLNFSLGSPPSEFLPWNLTLAKENLIRHGFKILIQNECFGYTRFFDIGAIVYYLKCIPWQIPDFSVEQYLDKLQSIHDYIESNGYFDLINHRFFLIAENH